MKSPLLAAGLLAAALARAEALPALPEMPTAYRTDPAAAIENARRATPGAFRDADLVIVDNNIHVRFEADGTDVAWDDEWVKALTEKGRRALASLSLDYSARYGDAAIQTVEIVGTNGLVRAVDFAQSLKTATDNSSMGQNIYDPLDRVLSCAVPGVAVGEIRHVVTCRRTLKPRMKGAWADLEMLEHVLPILATTVTVDAPSPQSVRHAVLRRPNGATAERLPDRPLPGGRALLAWRVHDVPQAFPEPNMPPLATQLQTLYLSTVPDWPAVSRWYWNLCAPHMAATPAMTNKVQALVRNCADDDAKTRALFKFVSQEIRYMGLTLEDAAPGYEPHDVALTFENRYGVCRDKAALLAALLRVAGLPAYPTLIQVGARKDPDVPIPYFNHAIVGIVRPDGSCRLLDPTDENSRDLLPAYLADCSYLVARPEGARLGTAPVKPADENLLAIASEGTLDADGSLLLTTRYGFTGINDTALRHGLVKKTPEERRRVFESFLRRVSADAELLAFELAPADLRDGETPLAAKTVARFPAALLRGKTRDALRLPFLSCDFGVARGILDDNTALEERRFTLQMPCTAGTRETLALTLDPALGQVLSLPKDLDTASPGFVCTRTLAVSNGVLRAARRFAVEAVEFAPDAYDELRDALKEVESAERDEPVFAARAADADAHVRTRLARTVVHFTSPRSWTATNVVEREILDYRGLKSCAELKFGYAPSTRSVELLYATVSNRDGRVQAVQPREINVMDCGWAARAPRYPASKTLVVTLPRVAIGSVVRHAVVHAVTNAPLAYTDFMTFDSMEPIVRQDVELHVPDGMPFQIATWERPPACTIAREAHGTVYRWCVENPRRLPNEPGQPPASFWRTCAFVTTAEWTPYARELTDALARARAAGNADARETARRLVADLDDPAARITALRRHLAHRVRIVGPGLFDLPFAQAFTAPDRMLAEGYASRPDQRNLLFAMLEAAGFDCAYVFATDDATGYREISRRYAEQPRPAYFSTPVIRATWRPGGLFGRLFGWLPGVDAPRTFWLAGENEYTPSAATARVGDAFFDPETGAFGEVAPDLDDAYRPRDEYFCRLVVQADGGVNFAVSNTLWGAGVGAFRKRFTEMLPEIRRRHHQQLLGNLAENAKATSEFTTDVESYPAVTAFSAFVPEYAVAKDRTLTLTLPDLEDAPFGVTGAPRKSPISVGGRTPDVTVREVVFPKGYAAVERLPDAFELKNPKTGETWMTQRVETRRDEEGRLVVRVARRQARPRAAAFAADYAPFFREWNRRASAREARTVSVRDQRTPSRTPRK